MAFSGALTGPSVTRKQVGKGTNRQMPTPTRNTTARDNSSERYPIIYIDAFVVPRGVT